MWLPSVGQRKTAQPGAEACVATMINDAHTPAYTAHGLVGLDRHAVTEELGKATPKRALALALAVGAWEADTNDVTWGSSYNEERTRHTLRTLGQWGHQLSDIETRIVENGVGRKAHQGWRSAWRSTVSDTAAGVAEGAGASWCNRSAIGLLQIFVTPGSISSLGH